MSAILSWAADQGWVEPRRIRRPKQPQGRLDWRTPDEIEALLDVAASLRPLLTFCVGTGCRASEALSLQWRDVSIDAQQCTFWETKSGYARTVSLQPRVRDALPARNTPLVWGRADTLRNGYQTIQKKLKRGCERHGLPDTTLHVLRHTWATWAYAATTDLTYLMQAGGWRSPTMVMRYAHTGSADLARAVERQGWVMRAVSE